MASHSASHATLCPVAYMPGRAGRLCPIDRAVIGILGWSSHVLTPETRLETAEAGCAAVLLSKQLFTRVLGGAPGAVAEGRKTRSELVPLRSAFLRAPLSSFREVIRGVGSLLAGQSPCGLSSQNPCGDMHEGCRRLLLFPLSTHAHQSGDTIQRRYVARRGDVLNQPFERTRRLSDR